MKVSYNWLKDYVEFDLTPDQLADELTMVGLEVAGVTPLGPEPARVVWGQSRRAGGRR